MKLLHTLLVLLPIVQETMAVPVTKPGPHVLPTGLVRVLRRKAPSNCVPRPGDDTLPDLDQSHEHHFNGSNTDGDKDKDEGDKGRPNSCRKRSGRKGRKSWKHNSWMSTDEPEDPECEDEDDDEDGDKEDWEDWEDNGHENWEDNNNNEWEDGKDNGDKDNGHSDSGNQGGPDNNHGGDATDPGGNHNNGTNPGGNHNNGTNPGGNDHGSDTGSGDKDNSGHGDGDKDNNGHGDGNGDKDPGSGGGNGDKDPGSSGGNGDFNNSTNVWVDPYSPSDWVPDEVRHINDAIPEAYHQALRYVPRQVDYASSGPEWLKLDKANALGSHASLNTRRGAQATFYSLQNPDENHGYAQTACGVDNPPDTYPLVAIPMVNWNELWSGSSWDAPFCGHLVRVRYGNRSATAQVLDGCAPCGYNSLDLSPVLFYYLTGGKQKGDSLGILSQEDGFSWEWLDDPTKERQEIPADGYHWDGSDPVGSNSGYYDEHGNAQDINDVWGNW